MQRRSKIALGRIDIVMIVLESPIIPQFGFSNLEWDFLITEGVYRRAPGRKRTWNMWSARDLSLRPTLIKAVHAILNIPICLVPQKTAGAITAFRNKMPATVVLGRTDRGECSTAMCDGRNQIHAPHPLHASISRTRSDGESQNTSAIETEGVVSSRSSWLRGQQTLD